MKSLIAMLERTDPAESRASGRKAALFLKKRIKGTYKDGLSYYKSIYDVEKFSEAFVEGFREAWEESVV